jgi:glycosyltransferase involved in cell wall biosynthesis
MIYHKISVITPSFNQGAFIEQTILSVIGQQYPNLEYIIIDGGSTDETVSIIKKYAAHITYWVSEKDSGQSAAINKGFARATGDIFCWLNSDDYYLPGTLLTVNQQLNIEKAILCYGNCIHLNEKTNHTHGSYFDPFGDFDINHGDFIAQPSSFWTRKAFELAGKLREEFHYGFDWEWYARAKANGVQFVPSPAYLSVYRIHDQQKSNDGSLPRFLELTAIEKQLNPEKYKYIDECLKKNIHKINLIYTITSRSRLSFLTYRTLKLFYPALMKKTDKITLKTYMDHIFKQNTAQLNEPS